MLLNFFIIFVCGLCAAVAQESTTVTQKLVVELSSTENMCSVSEWQCADGGCIPKEGLCNAVVNCGDASDEYLDTCVGVKRNIFRFQMLCFLCSAKTQRICPKVCSDQPEFSFYALLAETGSPNTCRLPPYPPHGKYNVKRLTDQAQDFKLEYTCGKSYALVESDPLQCVNGSWINEDKARYCTEVCPLYNIENITYTCDGVASCNDRVPIGTVVTVSRELADVRILCQADRTFNFTTSCVEDVEKLQQAFENPTLTKLTNYEAEIDKFKNKNITYELEVLVGEIHYFENEVKEKLAAMYKKSDECDLILDLLLNSLMQKMEV